MDKIHNTRRVSTDNLHFVCGTCIIIIIIIIIIIMRTFV